ncbi:MIP/aquaporin family protein [Natronosporangium hydrolyticum]|uniref:MIP/aquaporin family protein n=1 Tax=Natronosporangium hydrolyticum TaxID=2811111 RepID=UPI001EFA14A7|nr:MIP/aquaporin family protein [Natronosporangium hydrolyticum]
MDLGTVFISEVIGTGMLTLLGCGVVANVLLTRSKGFNGGWLLINFGWGLAVFAGVFVAYQSGGHINPAVTLGILASGADEYAPGVDITIGSTFTYFGGEFLGAFIGAVVAFFAYRKHFEAEEDETKKLAVFSTGPELRSYGWNFLTEVVGTFVLVLVVLSFANTPNELGPLAVALLVVGIGASLGGPTGYAINPARDLGPRIAHALLPTSRREIRVPTAGRYAADPGTGPGPGDEDVPAAPQRKSSDWKYAWVPVAGPIVGGVLAGLLSQVVF